MNIDALPLPNRPPILLDALWCGFRAFGVLLAPYPADFARGFGPFVDLLLTWKIQRKKPPGRAAIKLLI